MMNATCPLMLMMRLLFINTLFCVDMLVFNTYYHKQALLPMIPCECVLLSHVNSLHFNQWVSLIIVNKHFLSSLKRLFIQTKLLLNYFYVLLGLSTYFTFSHHVLIVHSDVNVTVFKPVTHVCPLFFI